jgi:hypothetical protein
VRPFEPCDTISYGVFLDKGLMVKVSEKKWDGGVSCLSPGQARQARGQAAPRSDWRIRRGYYRMRQFSRGASSPSSLLLREYGYRATLKTCLCAISCCCTIPMHAKSCCYPSSFLDNTFTLSSDADMTNIFLMSPVTNEHVHNALSVIAFLEMRFVVYAC